MRLLVTAVLLSVASGVPQDRALLLKPDAPAFTAPAPDQCVVRLETNKGNVDIEVTRAWAPIGADRFVNLVRHGYYNDNRYYAPPPPPAPDQYYYQNDYTYDPNRGADTGARIGARIGGAIGGPEGAAIGADIGRDIGNEVQRR